MFVNTTYAPRLFGVLISTMTPLQRADWLLASSRGHSTAL